MITCDRIIARRRELWEQHRDIERDREYVEAVARYIVEHEDIRREIQEYPEKLVEMCFVIVDKDKNTVPFFLNDVQRDFVERLNCAKKEFKEGKRLHLWFLITKGRQQGFTSFITAYQLACTITRKNFDGFTAADEDGNTAAIFEKKAKFPYNNLPDAIKPTEKYNNRKQLLFDKINSSWEVRTASKEMGRSRTPNFFHGSEVAFWKVSIADVQASMGEGLTKDAIQILESTANGYNEFKDLWDSGKWENCFYEWWRTPEYRHNFESAEKESWFREQVQKGDGWIWERCRWLLEIGLDWNQVYWYYVKWDSYIDKEKIKQEYPCSPEEAFIASGNSIFDQESVIHRINILRIEQAKNKPKRGYFTFSETEGGKPIADTVRFVEDDNGAITIYEDAKPHFPYVLGGDTAGEGSDWFSGHVIDNSTGKQVAVLHQQYDEIDYAKQIYCLALHYNTALVGLETNFSTYPTRKLEEWGYPKLYVRETQDTFTHKLKQSFGFQTTKITRPLIVSNLVAIVKESVYLINDIKTLEEMLTFVKNEQGKPEAQEGANDDLVMGLAITYFIREQQEFTARNEAVYSKDHWTDDMWEDYYAADAEGRAYLERKWGKVVS